MKSIIPSSLFLRKSCTIALATASFSLVTQPATATETTLSLKPTLARSAAVKQSLSYSELFDLGERYVDTVVYTMMDSDPGLIEVLFDINAVKVSSDGQFATVAWRYDRSMSGVTLLAQQGEYISILAERDEPMSQYVLQIMGVPPAAAAEIEIY